MYNVVPIVKNGANGICDFKLIFFTIKNGITYNNIIIKDRIIEYAVNDIPYIKFITTISLTSPIPICSLLILLTNTNSTKTTTDMSTFHIFKYVLAIKNAATICENSNVMSVLLGILWLFPSMIDMHISAIIISIT